MKSHGVLDGVAQQHDDFFGCSIDILGDINQDGVQDYIVGSYGYDGSTNLEGASYVLFMADDTTVSSYTRIAENENGFDEDIGLMDVYSKSLTATGDIDGDCIPDFIVGEPWNDDIATKMGAFFTHCLNADGSLKSYQKFDGNTPELSSFLQEGDRFGFVEYMGDLNNDGYPELAVGAYNDDANMASDYDSGAIYLISLNGVVPCESSITSNNKVLPISIYPNPASGYLWLESEFGNIESYVIYDEINRVAMVETNVHSSVSSVDISKLPDGVYFIQVVSENTIVTTLQFIKLPE